MVAHDRPVRAAVERAHRGGRPPGRRPARARAGAGRAARKLRIAEPACGRAGASLAVAACEPDPTLACSGFIACDCVAGGSLTPVAAGDLAFIERSTRILASRLQGVVVKTVRWMRI